MRNTYWFSYDINYVYQCHIFVCRTGLLTGIVTTRKSKARFVSSWNWCMPIVLGSQQDLWLAGRSERPHKVAGSWPDGLHVASSCNSRAVQCLIRACSVPEGRVTWDQHEGEGRTARYIQIDNAPASCFRDPRFMSGHRNGLCRISLFMVALSSSRQMLGCCIKFDPERLFMLPTKYIFL